MQRVHWQGSGLPGGLAERLITAGAYVVLLALGLLEGLVGSFQYSRALGSVPAAAIGFALLIGVTCVLGAWGMHQPMGALMPAVGWLVASFVLARGTSGGSVLITNTAAGQWFLFGGAVCTIAGVGTGFVRWSRRPGALPGTDAWRREIPPAGVGKAAADAPDGTGPGRPAQISDHGEGAARGGALGSPEPRNADSGQTDP
jgi:hypothetical protein